MNVPALRFPEFEGEWGEVEFGDVVSFSSGGTPSKAVDAYWGGEIPWISAASMHSDIITTSERTVSELGAQNGTRLAPENTVLMLVRGSMLYNRIPAGICKNTVTYNQDVKALTPKGGETPHFLMAYIRAKESKLLAMVTGTGIGAGKLDTDELKAMAFDRPSLPEQKKIADFLGVVDAKLGALGRVRTGLQDYKRGLMQALFAQTLRFTKPDGSAFPDWEEKRLGAVLHEHKLKSARTEQVFSVSVHKGLINQIEHLGRSFSAADTGHYNRVKPNDIVYTKSPTGDFPLGIIKQAHIAEDVIVSPLYGVFTPETPSLGYLLHVHFETPISVSNYLSPIVQKGAKNTINVTNSGFLSNKLILPVSRDEQRLIANALQAMDAKIAAVSDQITKMEAFKKGLLQQMFV
ncbi:restriction endonuclease subunit S [Yoonia sp. MH D7]